MTKKTFIIFFMLCLLCVSLCACGRIVTSNFEETSQDTEEEFFTVGDKAYSEFSCVINDDGSNSVLYVKSDYDSAGHLLCESVSRDCARFLNYDRIVHEYDGKGRLVRSVRYVSKQEDYNAIYTGQLEKESYIEYSHDEHGRAVSGEKFTAEGWATDVTVSFEYYGNGTLKRRCFYEDYCLTYLLEYDSLGRCVYSESNSRYRNYDLSVYYEGEARNASMASYINYYGQADIRISYDGEGSVCGINETYDDGLNEPETVSRSISYDADKRLSAYRYTGAQDYVDGKGGITSLDDQSTEETYTYNAVGKLAEVLCTQTNWVDKWTLSYDSENRPVNIRKDMENGYVWEYFYNYDAEGQLVREEHKWQDETGEIGSRSVTTHEYAPDGSKNSLLIRYGEENSCEYKHESRYDIFGNLVYYSNKYRGEIYEYISEMQYDGQGNEIKRTNKRVYDEGAREVVVEDLEYKYDEKNNLIWRSESYKNSNSENVLLEHEYNTRGDMISETETVYKSNGEVTVDYKRYIGSTYRLFTRYDASGNVIYKGNVPDSTGDYYPDAKG